MTYLKDMHSKAYTLYVFVGVLQSEFSLTFIKDVFNLPLESFSLHFYKQ